MLNLGVLTAAWCVVAVGASARGQFTQITEFPKTANAQVNAFPGYPAGAFVSPRGVLYSLVSNVAGQNYLEASGTVDIDVSGLGLVGVRSVYALMNSYSPIVGSSIATVTISGTNGASAGFELIAGDHIRDFYQGGFANTINGTTTQNAFFVAGVQGGAGTGNVNTGLFGNYLFDEIQFSLPAGFEEATLTNIRITRNSGGTPIVFGLTAAVPEPGVVWVLGTVAVLLGGRRR